MPLKAPRPLMKKSNVCFKFINYYDKSIFFNDKIPSFIEILNQAQFFFKMSSPKIRLQVKINF